MYILSYRGLEYKCLSKKTANHIFDEPLSAALKKAAKRCKIYL